MLNILRKAISYFAKPANFTQSGFGCEISFSGEAVTDKAILGISSVWACVNLLAGTIASLPLTVYVDNGISRIVAKEHPLYRLLHDSPNADQTALDFWEFICASLELWGNAYALITKSISGRITSLDPVLPEFVTVRRLDTGDIEYTITTNGKQRKKLQDEVFHVRGFGGSPLGGISTLANGRNAFGLALAVEKSASSIFKNGMRPSGVLTFEKFLTALQRQEIDDHLAKKFLGAINSGRPLILEGGTKFEALTINPEDAQMLESRAFSVEEVCRFFGVPPFMIGHTDKVTSFGSGLEQQVLGFQKFSLRRRLKRIEQALEKQLLSIDDRAKGITIEFNLEGLLRGDSAARAQFYQSGLTNGWMTINEVREIEKLPPVDGGDVPRMQMQNIPITEEIKPKLLAPPKGVTNGTA